jgi:putative ABC transport system ATP-binding protein
MVADGGRAGVSEEAPILSVEDVMFQWPGTAGFRLVIERFQLMRGARVLLLGQSGSGKSTLLSLIGGTVRPQKGRVVVNGTDLSGLGLIQRDRFRAETMGVIFQQFNLLPFANVLDNILVPLHFAPERRARVPDAGAEAGQLARALGLPEALLRAKARTLSVGQQQRVAAARAFIGCPPLIVADEPTSALDANTQAAFLDVLFRQADESGATLLMVSHDARLGAAFDAVIQMEDIARMERPLA